MIGRYGRIDLLCLDELGYIELDRRGAELLFQVFTEREEKASIAVASNAAFSEWTSAFTDPQALRRDRGPAHLRRAHHHHRRRLLPAAHHRRPPPGRRHLTPRRKDPWPCR